MLRRVYGSHFNSPEFDANKNFLLFSSWTNNLGLIFPKQMNLLKNFRGQKMRLPLCLIDWRFTTCKCKAS